VTLPLERLGVPLAARLAHHGDRVALVAPEEKVTYAVLAERVSAAARLLGTGRRLVAVAARPDVATVVTYLACLSSGHPVLLCAPDRLERMVAAFDPDVVVDRGVLERRSGSRHVLHDDLALLMSTSGSTGSPKLVRLSQDNVQSNAEAIVASLGIRPTDRAATTLPLHYCYGLSVLHSHLQAGASVVLTSLSVVDSCFWRLVEDEGVTSLAGVPHTFTLLERVGFADRELPTLRSLTQAGGRLEPDQVRRLAELGQRKGFDLFVMYGQTEATARMAVLEPDLAQRHPGTIGRPVPGGAFRLDEGELVYQGPNVMLGYATSPADLALGRTVHELRTGDLARLGPDGLYEIVGRRSRFLKVLGLRIDLDQVQRTLAAEDVEAACLGDDHELVVAATGRVDVPALHRRCLALTGLPVSAVRVCVVDELPRTASGKLDTPALERQTRRAPAPASTATSVAEVLADVLDRDTVRDDDSFVSLGGDSLSYVEASLRLEDLLGSLPEGWHLTPVRALSAAASPRRRWGRAVETGVLLRAVAILLVVAHHVHLFRLLGGAHLLLAVAGFNFARFQLAAVPRSERVRRALRAVARLTVPTVAVVLLGMLLLRRYGWEQLLLVHDLLHPDAGWKHFWFVEVLVQLLLACCLLLALPPADRAERRWPFATPLVLLGLALLPRAGVVPAFEGQARLFAPYAVAWLFVWGWAAARAATPARRAALTVVLAGALPGFFLGNHVRTAVVGAGLLTLLWVPRTRLPRAVVPAVGVLASASLYIYLAHFLVLPAVEGFPLPAFVAALAAGLAYWQVVSRVEQRVRRRVTTP
jgi:acyl-CoA synthetase (AMP-forming)/AMP-acid ligase II